jgi:hypothetical protein
MLGGALKSRRLGALSTKRSMLRVGEHHPPEVNSFPGREPQLLVMQRPGASKRSLVGVLPGAQADVGTVMPATARRGVSPVRNCTFSLASAL